MIQDSRNSIHTAGEFLTRSVIGQEIFTLENISSEQRLLVKTASDFMEREVLPRSIQIERAEPDLMRNLLAEAGELGLLQIDTLSHAEGLKVQAVIASQFARQASFFVAWAVQTGIGILPISYFASDRLKNTYLPTMATGKVIGAYAVTEAQAGSDATSIKTQARLAPDGSHYILNGVKQWISNAGIADVFTVLAKVDNTRLTEFVVEAQWEGVSTTVEDQKMGIRGVSNCSVYLNNVRVPVENIVGEVGKGSKIVFSIMNIGRIKLAVGCAAASREALNLAAIHATERQSFGKPIGNFGLIQKKLALMTVDTYAAESMAFRTMGTLNDHLAALRHSGQNDNITIQSIIEEHTMEASIVKVFGSEISGRVIDESLQIFGGYGYMQGNAVEQAYRDTRITRIFEGTNEINRLLISGVLLKHLLMKHMGASDFLPQLEAEINDQCCNVEDVLDKLTDAVTSVERVKRAMLYVVVKTAITFLETLEQEQEFLEYIADAAIALYALDSTLSRALAAVHNSQQPQTHILIAQLATWYYLPQIVRSLDNMLHAACSGATLYEELQRLHNFTDIYHINAIHQQRALSSIVINHKGYPLSIL